jgi:hypothetical protein
VARLSSDAFEAASHRSRGRDIAREMIDGLGPDAGRAFASRPFLAWLDEPG